jgi:hypothetical protein
MSHEHQAAQVSARVSLWLLIGQPIGSAGQQIGEQVSRVLIIRVLILLCRY